MAQITPMMQQYLEIKERHKDYILFFRLGDFYEMFFEDAKTASRELELVLTGRDCGLDERAPMCGIPYHAADTYISRLIEKGYKVAICEQLENPALAKGIVKRDIVKIITPGTVTDSNMLDESKNNYIMCIYKSTDWYGIAYCDISTGEFHTCEYKDNGIKKIADEIARLLPSEIIYNSEFESTEKHIRNIVERFGISLSKYDDNNFEYNQCIKKVHSQFKNINRKLTITTALCACGALINYIEETQKTELSHINMLDIYSTGDFMMLDVSTRRNLELTETIRNQSKKGSLLWVLDRTYTAMGARMIRRWIEEPLVSIDKINARLDSVEELYENIFLRQDIREKLNNIYDIERLTGKIVYGNINARDMIALKNSISVLPQLKNCLKECKSKMLSDISGSIDTLEDIYEIINDSIADDPPSSVKDGFIIKDGFNETIDKLRKASKDGKKWIAELEEKEREYTGIKSLKIGYTKVFGYYIEITNANLSSVPQDRYIRKQTLSNAERYITPELKEMEAEITGAEEKVVQLEYQVFCEIRDKIAGEIERIQKTSWAIASIDVLCSLAIAAGENDYIRPHITNNGTILIKDGRHPVVEKTLPNNMFVPNDTLLDNQDNRISIITGPNMAGKSTYMRQVALLIIMAQIGSFIPASFAEIGVVDRIFTRIGASDDLSSGQSTFMVEMSEVADIIKNSTKNSLILLDEVGRGTSTYDGLSIAWAVIEYISDKSKLGAKTLFATHYHELTELEGRIDGIKNYCISVKEHGDDIIFLRKIILGGADKSYGIQVAKLAGLPHDIIKRAREIMGKLEENDITNDTGYFAFANSLSSQNVLQRKNSIKAAKITDMVHEEAAFTAQNNYQQLDFFNIYNNDIIEELKAIDILNTTPMEAINILDRLCRKVKLRS